MVVRVIELLKAVIEYIGGVREEPPLCSLRWMASPSLWGIWWAMLILIVLTFSGQTSKFIYIDF
jgi:hypothetical protein